MVIQEKVKYLIMLTNLVERGDIKSALYFPWDANQAINYSGITVKCLTVSLKSLKCINFI